MLREACSKSSPGGEYGLGYCGGLRPPGRDEARLTYTRCRNAPEPLASDHGDQAQDGGSSVGGRPSTPSLTNIPRNPVLANPALCGGRTPLGYRPIVAIGRCRLNGTDWSYFRILPGAHQFSKDRTTAPVRPASCCRRCRSYGEAFTRLGLCTARRDILILTGENSRKALRERPFSLC